MQIKAGLAVLVLALGMSTAAQAQQSTSSFFPSSNGGAIPFGAFNSTSSVTAPRTFFSVPSALRLGNTSSYFGRSAITSFIWPPRLPFFNYPSPDSSLPKTTSELPTMHITTSFSR